MRKIALILFLFSILLSIPLFKSPRGAAAAIDSGVSISLFPNPPVVSRGENVNLSISGLPREDHSYLLELINESSVVLATLTIETTVDRCDLGGAIFSWTNPVCEGIVASSPFSFAGQMGTTGLLGSGLTTDVVFTLRLSDFEDSQSADFTVRAVPPGSCTVQRPYSEPIINNCSPGFKPKPTYGGINPDRCDCVPDSTPVCLIEGRECPAGDDNACRTSPDCAGYVCIGGGGRGGRGICTAPSNVCPMADKDCSEVGAVGDAECQAPGPVCAQYTCTPLTAFKRLCTRSLATPPTPTPIRNVLIKCDPADPNYGACVDCIGSDPTNPTGIYTAFGCLETNAAGLIGRIFIIALGLAGGIALLLIIYSGYKMITAAGNPEGLQGARETLTAAIVGLLFVIFSLVILEVIGFDILQIPGFGR